MKEIKAKSIRSLDLSQNLMTPDIGDEYCVFLKSLDKGSMDTLNLSTSEWKDFSGITLYSTYEMVKNIGNLADEKILSFNFNKSGALEKNTLVNNEVDCKNRDAGRYKAIDYQKFSPWIAATIKYCDHLTNMGFVIGLAGFVSGFFTGPTKNFALFKTSLTMASCLVPFFVYSLGIRDYLFNAEIHSVNFNPIPTEFNATRTNEGPGYSIE